MTPDPAIAAVCDLGYTVREAAFLQCVAVHSGYFVRRQFLHAIGRTSGKAVADFTARLVARRHATVQTFCRTTHVYHLSASALYGAAGAANSRHRRRRPAVSIKMRLMALDYVLTRPEVRFLATEAERLAHFGALGIDRALVPQRHYHAVRSRTTTTRYCDETHPLGVLVDAAGSRATELVYIDDGAASAAGFETYLCQYRRVLSALPRWRVVYVAQTPTHVAQAELVFTRVLASDGPSAAVPYPSADDPVLEYFRLRRAYEAQDWRALDKGALDRFRALRQRFASAAITAQYVAWKVRGESPSHDAATARRLTTPATAGAFVACVLRSSYAAIEGARGRS